MRYHFPGFKVTIHRDGRVVWTGRLQSNEDFRAYRIRVSYDRWNPPRVFVTDPCIPPGTKHTYNDGSLCLYWPPEWQWSDRECLATTIMPWAAMWVYYYEIYLITNEWLGPEAPH